MGALDKSIMVFSALYLTAITTLALTGDKRPDVYVSVSALLYFIYISLDENVRRNTRLAPVSAALFAAFAVAVAYRIAQILGWSP